MEENHTDKIIEILLVGNSGAGKSSKMKIKKIYFQQ